MTRKLLSIDIFLGERFFRTMFIAPPQGVTPLHRELSPGVHRSQRRLRRSAPPPSLVTASQGHAHLS